MDIKAEREVRSAEREAMRIELEHAYEEQEKAQRVIARATLSRKASDETRLSGVPNASSPMSSISPETLDKHNNSVLMTTTAPLCVECNITMWPRTSLGAALQWVLCFSPVWCLCFGPWDNIVLSSKTDTGVFFFVRTYPSQKEKGIVRASVRPGSCPEASKISDSSKAVEHFRK
jgi:hypothetical protein